MLLAEINEWFDKLTNFGGLGVAVWMLYTLHTSSQKAFKEEMAAERERSDKRLAEERELWKEAIEAIVGRLDHIETKLDELVPYRRRGSSEAK